MKITKYPEDYFVNPLSKFSRVIMNINIGRCALIEAFNQLNDRPGRFYTTGSGTFRPHGIFHTSTAGQESRFFREKHRAAWKENNDPRSKVWAVEPEWLHRASWMEDE